MSAENIEYARAMHGLRSSNAACKHKDKHAEKRKGFGKGGRKAWKNSIEHSRL